MNVKPVCVSLCLSPLQGLEGFHLIPLHLSNPCFVQKLQLVYMSLFLDAWISISLHQNSDFWNNSAYQVLHAALVIFTFLLGFISYLFLTSKDCTRSSRSSINSGLLGLFRKTLHWSDDLPWKPLRVASTVPEGWCIPYHRESTFGLTVHPSSILSSARTSHSFWMDKDLGWLMEWKPVFGQLGMDVCAQVLP